MTITLITGGNKGLGLETARRLIGLGHTVYVGSRDAEKGSVAAIGVGAKFVQLDVTDDESVDAAAASILAAEGVLDVLVNNAGIAGIRKPVVDVTASDVRATYETNVFGLVRVTHAMIPLLQKSASPVIVNVSSGLGSLGTITDPSKMEFSFPTLAYGSSKSAVLGLTVQYSKALPDMRVNAADPGYTATDLNSNQGTQTISEGTDAIVELATLGPDGPTGTFISRHGPMPW